MPFSTRPARPDDIPHLCEMITALAAFHGDTARISPEKLQQNLFTTPPWISVIVAQDEIALLGYAALYPQFQLQFATRSMDMHHLFVAPSHRGQGVGKALINAAIDHAKSNGCTSLCVGTHPDNIAAQNLYLLRGFGRITHNSPRFRLQISPED